MADTDPKSKVGASEFVPDFDFNKARQSLDTFSNQIITTFTQGRERVFEFQRAITDSLPAVRRLGGDIGDVTKIIIDVAEASKRNVVASSEQIEDLFKVTEVLGLSVKEVAESFLDVGIAIDKVDESLEESVKYIQSIGGNARQVMKDVEDNMAQMNRFQFEGGVQGLTKMAAQASMLRFDMKQTFQLADRVLNPEGAIEVAAAFQRLGVAAGNLTDPFQLMNLSINDPQGLQDSLVDVAKQFTEFDEKTGRFKINPQGVLTLREMAERTGVSAQEMSKLGLAAAELDARLSEISPEITFANEEDKQYLANIANLEGGKYMVTLDDNTKKELSELTQPEFDKLIEEQKNQPKTLEDVARAQLTVDEQIANDIAAIRYAIMGGVLTDENVQSLLEGFREGADVVLRGGGEAVTTGRIRDISETLTGGFKDILKEAFMSGDILSVTDRLQEKATGVLGDLSNKSKDILKEGAVGMINELQKKGFGENIEGTQLDSLIGNLVGKLTNIETPTSSVPTTTTGNNATRVTVEGLSTANQNLPDVAERANSQKSIIELLGNLTVDVNFQDLPSGLTAEQKEQIVKTFSDKINDINFKNYILGVTKEQSPLAGNGFQTY